LGIPDERRRTLALAAQHPRDARAALLDHFPHAPPKGLVMPLSRPAGSGHKEEISLDAAARHVLEECRMVLPGIQALFGFQLIAVFNQGFGEKLSQAQQVLHLVALVLTTLSMALVMTPAALHRQ